MSIAYTGVPWEKQMERRFRLMKEGEMAVDDEVGRMDGSSSAGDPAYKSAR